MKVVILDGYSVTQGDLDWGLLQELPDTEVMVYDRTRPEETVKRCQGAEAVLTNKVVMNNRVMETLPQLRYIGVLATGYNVVDIEAAHTRGVTVTNIPAYSTPSVAQLVFAHLLNVTNQVAHYAEENRQGRWTKSPDFLWTDTPLTELSGKTMGIRGLGNIGRQVAQIARAFGMRVVAVHSGAWKEERGERKDKYGMDDVERMTWEEVLKESDVLSLHCPLTEETRGMMNRKALGLMKPTAILINTGRGPLVCERDVADALRESRLAAYCADVLSQEPPLADNPLLSAPRCYLTPHIAWASREARLRLIHTAVSNLQAFAAGKAVNKV